MLQPLREQPDDVVVVEGVEDETSVAARAHEAHAAQQAELMRNSRLGQPEQFRQVADAQLGPRQRVEHPHARHVAEGLEGFGERRSGFVPQQLRPDGNRRLPYHERTMM